MSEYTPKHRLQEVVRAVSEIYKHGQDPRVNYPNLYQDVIDFHKHFELHGNTKPGILPGFRLQAARLIHLYEELHEYSKAVQHEDMKDALDALVDLVYVALGTAYFHGFDFNEAWRRVHYRNMQKIRVKSAKDSKRGTEYDVVKPEGWVAPNLEDLV